MTTESLPAKGAGGMQFAGVRADDLWGRQRSDPKWRTDGGSVLVNGVGNKLKLVDGKWKSA